MVGKSKIDSGISSRIVELYAEETSCHAIGKTLNLGGQTVRRHLESIGVSLRPESIKPRYDPALKNEVILAYETRRLSAAVIAKQFNLKSHTVKDWLRSAAATRSMSEAASLSIANGDTRSRAAVLSWSSSKTGETVHASSTYEIIRMAQLDQDGGVKTWARCKDTIPYMSRSGKRRHYTPDFLVTRIDGSCVIEEVKPSTMMLKMDNPEKFLAALLYYELKDMKFSVVTEATLGSIGTPNVVKGILHIDSEERRAIRRARQKAAVRLKNERQTDEQRRAQRAYWALKARRLRNSDCAETNYYKLT